MVEPGEVAFLVGASYDDVRACSAVVLAGAPAHPDRNTLPPFSVSTGRPASAARPATH